MNEKFSNELISALFDGEVSPDERAEAQRQIASSSETRREFQEIQSLSKLLQDMSHDAAPNGFRAEVLQAAQRKMLLAETGPVGMPHSERRSPNRLWQGVVALVAMAAVLFVAVWLFDASEPAGGPNNQHIAVMSDQAEKDAESEFRLSEPSAAPASRTRSQVDFAEKQPRKSATMFAEKLEAKPGADAAVQPNVGELASTRNAPNFGLILNSKDELKNARIGQIIKALETSGGQVAVVKLTVIDRRAGLRNLQVLLSRHRIPKTQSDRDEAQHGKAASENAEHENAKPLQPESNRLVAVYVEAPSEQLASVLLELKQAEQFRKLHVERSVELSRLDAYSENVPTAPKAKMLDERKPSEKELARISRQFELLLPSDVLSGPETPPRPNALALIENQRAFSKRFQVLFVLVADDSNTGSGHESTDHSSPRTPSP
jgi:hypothetical protein